jgi:simple sugar transport system permease protein
VSSLIAVACAIVAAVLLLVFASPRPGEALSAFFIEPLANRYYFGNMLDSFSYLLIAGLGIVISFRAGLYNLGGEGQILCGALCGTLVGIALPGAPAWVGKVAVALTGATAGALMAGACGVARRLWKTPEIITTFLLSAALIRVAEYVIAGPADDPERNLIATRSIPEQLWLSRLLQPSQLNGSVVVALFLAGVTFFLLFRTVAGYELRLLGHNEEFALYAGINTGVTGTGALSASGALHGLAGTLIVMGTHHATLGGMSAGIGWNGIAVALIARLHPLAAIPAAAAFSYLEAGVRASELHTDFALELGAVIKGVIFLLVTAVVVLPRVWRKR